VEILQDRRLSFQCFDMALKVVHINTFDTTGGAALATYRLHKGLCRMGVDSSMLVAHRASKDPTVIEFAPSRGFVQRFLYRLTENRIHKSRSRYIPTRPRGLEKFSDDRTPYGSDLPRHLPPCDVINLHWISGFLDYREFFACAPRNVPIFWRLSDMNPLTGGCHFDDGCGRYNIGCGSCPQLGSTDSKDLSHQVWQRKLEALRTLEPERLHIIPLNHWMAETVRKSPLLGRFPMTMIPNGVDTTVFAPRDTRVARDLFGVPPNARVALFGADVVNNRRKGFQLLMKALDGLPGDIFLLSVGQNAPQIETAVPHLHLGHIADDRLLSLAYNAADVYVIPSLQDNQPNTVLEAMACGTPVIGFDAGGIPDMVRPGKTGLLVPVGDIDALRKAIIELLQYTETRREMASNCRRIVMEEYTRELQVSRYAELYGASLSGRSSSSREEAHQRRHVAL
jgi:glycosyltransferase involved in cell wall biosynthesis